MMKTFAAAVVLSGVGLLVCAGLTHGQESQHADALLKARVLQLEAQLKDVAVQASVCQARLALSDQAQAQSAIAQQRTIIERDAGCALEWTATPPTCKPVETKP